jgi:hypothetical protein
VNQFIVGPDGRVYILFRSSVNLDDTTQYGSCRLAEVDPTTGVPTCIDSSLWISWPPLHSGRNAPIQFDAAGAVYYSGGTGDGHTVLRRYYEGTVTDLVNQNINLWDFLVLPDGGVVLTGTTASTQAPWLRYLSRTGSLQGLAPVQSSFLRRFPDGNVYVGLWGSPNFGVSRFLTATQQLESKYWISAPINNLVPDKYFDANAFCQPDVRPVREGFCGWFGSYIEDSFTTGDGKVFAIAGSGFQGGTLMQYFPSVAAGTTAVQKVYSAQSVGNDLVLSGLNSAGQNITNLYDTATGLEAPIFDPTNEMEIYHLTYVPETHKMLFDGLRFSDNKYVFGEIDFT